MIDYIDNSVNPGDNFFKFATGKWLEMNPQPAEYPVWQTFTKLEVDNLYKIRDIITHPDGSVISQKINVLYNIIMDDEKRQKDGISPVKEFIDRYVKPIKNHNDFFKFIAKNHFTLFFNTFIGVDDQDNENNIVQFWQSGLSLGNKDYYLSYYDQKNPDPHNKKIVEAFFTYIENLFKYFGYDEKTAISNRKTIWMLEYAMAGASYSIEEEQEPSLNYHKVPIEELNNIAGINKRLNINYFNLVDYLTNYGYGDTDNVIVSQIKPLQTGCSLLTHNSLAALKVYLEYIIMDLAANMCDDSLYDIQFEFKKVMTGATVQMPKWKRAINTVNNICDEAIGQIYVNKYFSEEHKEAVTELVKELIQSYRNIIDEQQWMSEETKALALQKLDNMTYKIGYPEEFEDLTDIPISEGLSYFDTYMALRRYFFELDKKRHYNKPVDKKEWHMSPQTVNAYYNPVANEIVFPAGILAAPFFSLEQTDAENYGGIGAVIGHEMTHGFDNHGREYDINGQLFDWWNEDDIEKFTELTSATKEHFNNLEVLPGLKCNGSLTLGENLADYGGLKIAYNALQNHKENDGNYTEYTKEQLFFISYAVSWAGVSTDEAIRQKTLNNEHSVNYMRVNGTLPMFTPWYKAFKVTSGNKLYIPKKLRAKIW